MDYSNQFIDTIHDYVIIGGGLAGLAAANRLIDFEKQPILIEANSYPSHKVCGEFLSPESLPYLKQWSIHPHCSINRVSLFSSSHSFSFNLPIPAASMSRYQLDHLLVERIKHNGGTVLTETKVDHFSEKRILGQFYYQLELSNGQTLKAKYLFIGAGRIFQPIGKKITFPYSGFKAHFEGINLLDTLEMHLLPQAYLGISQIEKNIVNVACLAKIESNHSETPQQYIHQLINASPKVKERLDQGKMLFNQWLYTPAPHFGVKQNPHTKNIFFIGDAAGTISPATGGGLGMAITSGCLAASYAIKEDTKSYYDAWKKYYRFTITKGNYLHQIMLSPFLANTALKACHLFPALAHKAFLMTRRTVSKKLL